MNTGRNIATVLYAVVILFLVISGIDPHDRFTWLLEVSWVLVGLALLIYLNFKHLSITWLLALSLFVHALILIYGGWYTYENVPLGAWIRDIFGFDRNHYDRIGHFAQGFVPAILYREVLYRNNVVNGVAWRELVVLGFVMAFTALFELLEFGAALAFGQAADAFLGSQKDQWDAQWDMLFCGLGGVLSVILLSKFHLKQLMDLANTSTQSDEGCG